MGRTSDVRMAQYEPEARIPKHNLVKEIADILGVSSHALTVPDMDTDLSLMHTLLALKDIHGFQIDRKDVHICLCLNSSNSAPTDSISTMLQAWQQAEKLEDGKISKEEYNEWRYRYPELDTNRHWAKTPSKEMNDYLVKKFEKKLKKMQ